MTEIKLYKTKDKGLKIAALAIPFVVIGIWMISQASLGATDYILGWICTCFFGLGIPVGLFQAFDRRPQIIITENGVWDRTIKQDEIKWEQIIEANTLEIFDQKYISLVTDDTFIFKKKQYKWVSKMNKAVGAQQLNLHLGQITVDENQLADLINKLSKTQKEDREKLIQEFKASLKTLPISYIHKIPLYILISIGLLLLSLISFSAFMTIMILMGIAALIASWYLGSNNNSKLRKYAGTITYLGLVNMVLMLMTLEAYDYTTEKVGLKIATEIENYRGQFESYPISLAQIKDNVNLNLIERYFANKIEYRVTDKTYTLGLKTLLKKHREYDKELHEWKKIPPPILMAE